jgi:CubicO group peptidase (beta-lactamase class C family)
MRAATPWLLASITKLHIATVVLRLHERGVVDLDAPVSAYLPPELARGLHVLDGVDYTERITPTHLLGHLTGLPNALDERPRGGRSLLEEVLEDGDRAWSAEDAVARARDRLRPHFPPSDPQAARPRIRYSDTNFLLLMVIAEHLTGRSMGALYRELLFEPLGLAHTWFPGDEPLQPAGEPATVWLGDRPVVDRPLAMRSFGDLYGTVGDVLRFGRALFTGAVFDDPATLELMVRRFHRFGFPRSAATLRAPSWPIEYGLGVMRFAPSRALAFGRRLPGLLGHTGSTGSWLWHCPELGLMLAGTVDQATAVTVPFRPVPNALAGLAE